MKVIGIRKLDFTGNDGKPVKGTQFFLSESLEAPAEGVSTEKVFLKPDALAQMSYIPKMGDNVEVRYNKYGKASALVLLK